MPNIGVAQVERLPASPAKKARQTNLELLRTIAMFLIVLWHGLNTGILNDNNLISDNLLALFLALAIVSTNCYVLISGYFLIDSKFKIKNVLSIWFKTLFYSVTIFALFFALSPYSFSFSDLLHSVFPVILQSYWFVTCYILLYFLFPLLNLIIKKLSKKQFTVLLVALLLVFSIYDSFIWSPDKYFEPLRGGSLLWFVILYFVAAYLKLYAKKLVSLNKYVYLAIYFVFSVFLSYFNDFATAVFNRNLPFDFYKYNSVIVLISSVSLFLFFSKVNIKNRFANAAILFIAPLTFGIYLIHNNIIVIKSLWTVLLTPFANSAYTPLVALAVSLFVFIVCGFADFFVNLGFAKLKIVDRFLGLFPKTIAKINALYQKN
ncbi:MAG: acyltransferase [Oscillospiraceae bacterium]|jgi:surface polysaccharide O-acyltransferase-like enzyme|nr:acyltransferase [Oscillospiraceae bacterium]